MRLNELSILNYLPSEGSVLDLGCGKGEFSKICCERNLDVIGVDHCPDRLKIAQRSSPSAYFMLSSCQDLSQLGSLTFNFIWSAYLLSNLPNDATFSQVLNQMKEHLSQDGRLVILDYHSNYTSQFSRNREGLFYLNGQYYYHHTFKFWMDQFRKAGLLLQSYDEYENYIVWSLVL